MAQITITTESFSLLSSWRCSSNGASYMIVYGPTTSTKRVTFSYALPSGAIINSAKIYATLGSPLSGAAVKTVNGVDIVEGVADVTKDATLNQLVAEFCFRAYGRIDNDTNLHQGALAFDNVRLVIDYTPPNSEWSLDVAEVEAGGSIKIALVPVDKSFTHILLVKFGAISESYVLQAGVVNYRLRIPLVWLNEIPSATSGIATLSLQTVSDGTVLGTSEARSLIIKVPDTVVPVGGTLTLTPMNEKWGMCVQGQSAVRAVLTDYSCPYGATVSSITIAGGGYSSKSSVLVTDALATAGVNEFVATVVDSRGRMATAMASIEVTAYDAPRIEQTRQTRADSTGAPTNDGTYISAAVIYGYSAIGENAVSIEMKYRVYGATNWTTGYSGALENAVYVTFGNGLIGTAQTYEVLITVMDAFSTTSTTRTIGPASAYVVWDPANNAVGFGRHPSGKNRMQIAGDWDLYLGAKTVFDHLHPVGSVCFLGDGVTFDDATYGTWAKIGSIVIDGASVNAWKRMI